MASLSINAPRQNVRTLRRSGAFALFAAASFAAVASVQLAGEIAASQARTMLIESRSAEEAELLPVETLAVLADALLN
jgi:hypothetical protein